MIQIPFPRNLKTGKSFQSHFHFHVKVEKSLIRDVTSGSNEAVQADQMIKKVIQ